MFFFFCGFSEFGGFLFVYEVVGVRIFRFILEILGYRFIFKRIWVVVKRVDFKDIE